MPITDVTPIMTSKTTPYPYVVSASSEYNGESYPVWRAFNNTNENDMNDTWAGYVATLSSPQWIKIDMSVNAKINIYRITTRNYNTGINPPKSWVLQGSDNDLDWIDIDKRDGEFVNLVQNETREYICKESNYRYYRLFITETNGSTYMCIGEFRLLYDNSLIVEKTPLSINKTLKTNLPPIVDMGKDELHFTEDGGIYINDKNGNLVQCNTGNIIKEINNPLTVNPLEYLSANNNITTFSLNTPLELSNISGNISMNQNKFLLKKDVLYELILEANGVFTQQTSQMDVAIYNENAGKTIPQSKISLLPTTATNIYTTQSNISHTMVLFDADTTCYVTVPYNINGKSMAFRLSIKEVRNNPVNQYGGFETQVLFDGNANSVGEYILSDDINNYDFLLIEQCWKNSDNKQYGKANNIVIPKNLTGDSKELMYNATFNGLGRRILYGLNEKKLMIGEVVFDAIVASMNITKITAFKGQLPSLLCGGEF